MGVVSTTINEAIIPNASRRQNVATMASPPGAVDEGHELGAGFRLVLEAAAHSARGADAVGLADAADRHAAVRRFQNDADAAGIELLHEQVGDVLGHALLHLRP